MQAFRHPSLADRIEQAALAVGSCVGVVDGYCEGEVDGERARQIVTRAENALRLEAQRLRAREGAATPRLRVVT